MRKMELLAPAGNMEKLRMALRYGADAVYLAGQSFGLRAFGGNFSDGELREAVEFTHSQGKKVYITVNIIPRNSDLERLEPYIKYIRDIGADAVIISDLGIFSAVREWCPDLNIHVSTQASTSNWRTARVWKNMGASRVVLARELSLDEIQEIHDKAEMETEVFIHGAMCISWSGRCLLSNYFTEGQRDSNRGECIQACRFRYTVMEESRPGQYWPIAEDENGTYLFNSKDLCLLDYLPELQHAGVSSLKIEGRMKSVYYAAAVVSVYRRALDAFYAEGSCFHIRPEWRAELESVSHRPYTTGFAFGRPGGEGQEYSRSQPVQTYDFVARVLSYDRNRHYLWVEQRNRFAVGETLECLCPDGTVCSLFIQEMKDQEGLFITAAPHPLQHVALRCEEELPEDTILRRKNSHVK